MAANTIARGAVVLTANADQMVRGLNQAKSRVQQFGKQSGEAMKQAGELVGGGGGGAFSKALGAGFMGGIAGALVVRTLNAVVEAIGNIWTQTAKWEMELGRVQFRASELERTFDRMLRVRDEWTAIADRPDMSERLKKDIAAFKTLRETALSTAELMRQRIVKLDRNAILAWFSGDPTPLGAYLAGDREKELSFARDALKRAEAEATKFGEKIADAAEKMKRLTEPAKDPAFVGQIKEFTKNMDFQRQTIGMAAEEAQIFKFQMQGATDAMLAQARAAWELLKNAREAHKLLKEGPKFAAAVEKGSREAYTLEIRNRFRRPDLMPADEKAILEARKTNDLLRDAIKVLRTLQVTGVI